MPESSLRTSLNMATLVIFAAILIVAGCTSTTGYQRAGTASASMSQLRQELIVGRQQIDATLNALDRLVGQPSLDLRTPFAAFRREVSLTDAQANRTGRRADSMWRSGQDYIDAWDAEMSAFASAGVRQRSEERRAEVIREYQMLARVMTATRDAFQPFMADIRDIERALSTDLTRSGIANVAPLVEKASADGDFVRQRIDQALAQLDAVARSLGPQG